MKRFLCTFLTLALICAFIPAVFAEEAAETEGAPGYILYVENGEVRNGTVREGNSMVCFTSGNVIKFGFTDSFDPMLHLQFADNVDTAEYPFMAAKIQNTSGAETNGQFFYNDKASGATASKVMNFKWEPVTDWQWTVIDFTGCGLVGYLRFDVFGEAKDTSVEGMLAAVAFFRTAGEAAAFADSEQGRALGSEPGSETVADYLNKEASRYFYLYNKESKISTGWWFNPYTEGMAISIDFYSGTWFSGVWMFVYASQNPAPILLALDDDAGNEVFSRQVSVFGNDEFTFDFEKSFAPGYYTLRIEAVEYDGEEGSIHFVLGSAEESDESDVTLMNMGGNTNENTQGAPAVRLVACEPDPDYTEKPTATPKPTAAYTPVPTEVPAEETAQPVETDGRPAEDDGEKNTAGKGIIIGIAAGIAVCAAAAVIIVLANKKKKKAG